MPDGRSSAFRVLLASTQKGWGGGEVYLSTLGQHLRERGFEVEFAVRAGSMMDEYVQSNDYVSFAISGRGCSPLALLRLRRWIQKRQPAVIHCNDSHSLTSMGLACVGLPFSRTVAMRHTVFPIRSPQKYRRLCDSVVCVSHSVADTCESQGIPHNMLRVIHSGIDIPVVEPTAVEKVRTEFLTGRNSQLVVAVGNLVSCKGHADLIQAADLLKRQGADIRTVIAGEGDQRSELERRIAESGLQDDVLLAGFRTDANDLLAAADVVVHPAYEEGLCLTVAAALMLKKPVVCTSIGGLGDVIGADSRMKAEGPFAATVEPGRPDQLAAVLHRELLSPRSQKQRDVAAKFAVERFSATQMTDRTIRLYCDLQETAATAA